MWQDQSYRATGLQESSGLDPTLTDWIRKIYQMDEDHIKLVAVPIQPFICLHTN